MLLLRCVLAAVCAVAVCADTGPTSRLTQICEWLGDGDYVVVFDECHKAKNAVTKEKSEWLAGRVRV